MNNHKIAGFDLPQFEGDNKLQRLLSSALKKYSPSLIKEGLGEKLIYWNASYFGLDKVNIFLDASAEEQADILQLCSYELLEEAYFVEKAGMGYTAKMVLLAESTEERMLYALFSADEATHLAKISCFIHTPKPDNNNPFLRFLGDLLETDDKAVLLFLLQVVLEGWGLSHYRSLAKSCLNPDLGAIFHSFLQDESRHHASGTTLFNQRCISKASYDTIIESLALFLQMVQVGPQSVLAAIERVKGHLSREQKVNILQELDTESHSGIRLHLLRSLMYGEAAGVIVEGLDMRGAFQPFVAERCV